jgi:acetyl-CoA C-acetyltransferase
MTNIYIIDAIRTPIGRFGGSLKRFSAVDLGSIAIKHLIDKHGIPYEAYDIVLMGHVLRTTTGQDTARQAAIKAGLPLSLDAMTIDMVCSSGMASVILGSSMLRAGDLTNGLAIVGGMESMSNAPFAIPSDYRWGVKFILNRRYELIDTMYHDGLYDIVENKVMGDEADKVAKERGIVKEELDEIGYRSQIKALKALNQGLFRDEIIPIRDEAGEVILDRDEGIRENTSLEKIRGLKPVFSNDGLHTAATSSQISDGAAALILGDEDAVSKYDLSPRARIIGYSWASTETWRFVEAPPIAIKKILDKTGFYIKDIDVFENNEAFAVSSIVVNQDLGIDYDRLNLFGGALALGHPIGCSGARIIVTLLNVMEKKNYRYGMASLCHGLGGATAILVERL